MRVPGNNGGQMSQIPWNQSYGCDPPCDAGASSTAASVIHTKASPRPLLACNQLFLGNSQTCQSKGEGASRCKVIIFSPPSVTGIYSAPYVHAKEALPIYFRNNTLKTLSPHTDIG